MAEISPMNCRYGVTMGRWLQFYNQAVRKSEICFKCSLKRKSESQKFVLNAPWREIRKTKLVIQDYDWYISWRKTYIYIYIPVGRKVKGQKVRKWRVTGERWNPCKPVLKKTDCGRDQPMCVFCKVRKHGTRKWYNWQGSLGWDWKNIGRKRNQRVKVILRKCLLICKL